MKNGKIRLFGGAVLAVLWASLVVFAWFGPRKEMSESERRPLAQMPQLSVSDVLDGKFMEGFEDYSLDQFPLRDTFRQIKSLFHYYVLGQKDNNGIYLADGYAVKQEYPFREESAAHAANRLNHLYEKYLADTDANIVMAIVPDKGFYLAQESGHLTMDYNAMKLFFREKLPWAEQVELTDTLEAADYYRTDTHWRQEALLEAAGRLCDALNVTSPVPGDYTMTALDRPFYGVYYGQAALPMEPETMYILESDLLDACSVYDYESGKTGAVYDESKLEAKDLYEVFLSGPRSLLTIENPNAATDRELIIFRDSFGSSIAPLLVQDYAKVTLVDIRYIQIDVLDRFLTFENQDILLLYSTLVLNNSSTMK